MVSPSRAQMNRLPSSGGVEENSSSGVEIGCGCDVASVPNALPPIMRHSRQRESPSPPRPSVGGAANLAAELPSRLFPLHFLCVILFRFSSRFSGGLCLAQERNSQGSSSSALSSVANSVASFQLRRQVLLPQTWRSYGPGNPPHARVHAPALHLATSADFACTFALHLDPAKRSCWRAQARGPQDLQPITRDPFGEPPRL
mmetsp:Transcript_56177/g.76604  ORF Transcript_56177/g.76604 Transcript_56177/m.76604 type:complete len:201 (-) Transcript_56177:353-955(-)